MAIQLEIPFKKSLSIPKSQESVAAYLADVTKSIPDNFSGIESFKEVGPSTYEWRFEGFSYANYNFQIQFQTELLRDGDKTLSMKPKGKGPHALETCWALTPKGGTETEATFTAKLTIELPVPGFLKAMAAPIAQKEITKLFERYFANVSKHLTA